MQILMSIKPKYVKMILSGEKKFEFRKKVFKNAKDSHVIIYSSSPEKLIVGKFKVNQVLKGSPENIWEICKKDAGIDEKEFTAYFRGKEIAYAIEIINLTAFNPPINPREKCPNFHAPQSYCYFEKSNCLLEDFLDRFS